MFQIRLNRLKDEQRDKWLKTVLPLVIGKNRREADRILFKARTDKYDEMKKLAEEQGVDSMVFCRRRLAEDQSLNHVQILSLHP